VTSSCSKRSYLASDNNRELVTSIEAISAGGIVIEEMLILPGKIHMERFYRDLQGEVLVGLSESGYSNDELAFEYIHHFDRQTRKYQQGAHRILLCDGYKSHLTREILEFCEHQQIHIFALPPHTSHILQPLNVVLFQPFKHFHAKAVDNVTRTGCSHFDKLEFLATITSIRKETFKRNSILSAFRECGLVPYNPQIVLQKEQEYQPLLPPRPPTPPKSLDLPPTTPLTNRALEKQASLLQKMTPSRHQVLQEKFIKGALIQAKTGAQTKRQLAETSAAERERRERRCQSQRPLQRGGVFYPQEARNMTKQREEEGGTQLERASKREQKLRKELEEERQRRSNLARHYVEMLDSTPS
jgi:DDE superfamily endonuclease